MFLRTHTRLIIDLILTLFLLFRSVPHLINWYFRNSNITSQAVVLDTIVGIDLSISGAPSLVIRDLSEHVTLPFLAAFDVQPTQKNPTLQKRITYIALSKKTMPMLVELFLRFKTDVEIYVDGTIESILAVSFFFCLLFVLLN